MKVTQVAQTFSCLHLFVAHSLSQGLYSNTTGIGAAGPNDLGQEDRFASGARMPLIKNNVSFPGFNFDLTPSNGGQQDLSTSSNWTWHLNLSAIEVTNHTRTPNIPLPQLVTNIVFDLAFPGNETSLPLQNDTNWTMCGHFLNTPFPSNLSSRFPNETGDCSATLGPECLAAYHQAFLTSPLNTGSNCPSPPFWRDIPECYSQLGGDFGMVSAGLMNWTDQVSTPGSATSQNASAKSYHGLESTQPIFWQNSQNFNESLVSDYLHDFGVQMRMMVLTFQPSAAFVATTQQGASSTTMNREARILCAAANPVQVQRDQENVAAGHHRGMVTGSWWGALLVVVVALAMSGVVI